MASIRWVRPDLTTVAHSTAFASRACSRCSRAGSRFRTTDSVAATWIDVGNTSFEDWEALTWSFGCTLEPNDSAATVAMTSLAFMFELVPEPVWNTSSGKSAANSPAATRSAALFTASPISAGITPSRTLTVAAADLISASALICDCSRGRPEIGKFSTARWVCAWYLAFRGTRTSPMVSCSMR